MAGQVKGVGFNPAADIGPDTDGQSTIRRPLTADEIEAKLNKAKLQVSEIYDQLSKDDQKFVDEVGNGSIYNSKEEFNIDQFILRQRNQQLRLKTLAKGKDFKIGGESGQTAPPFRGEATGTGKRPDWMIDVSTTGDSTVKPTGDDASEQTETLTPWLYNAIYVTGGVASTAALLVAVKLANEQGLKVPKALQWTADRIQSAARHTPVARFLYAGSVAKERRLLDKNNPKNILGAFEEALEAKIQEIHQKKPRIDLPKLRKLFTMEKIFGFNPKTGKLVPGFDYKNITVPEGTKQPWTKPLTAGMETAGIGGHRRGLTDFPSKGWAEGSLANLRWLRRHILNRIPGVNIEVWEDGSLDSERRTKKPILVKGKYNKETGEWEGRELGLSEKERSIQKKRKALKITKDMWNAKDTFKVLEQARGKGGKPLVDPETGKETTLKARASTRSETTAARIPELKFETLGVDEYGNRVAEGAEVKRLMKDYETLIEKLQTDLIASDKAQDWANRLTERTEARRQKQAVIDELKSERQKILDDFKKYDAEKKNAATRKAAAAEFAENLKKAREKINKRKAAADFAERLKKSHAEVKRKASAKDFAEKLKTSYEEVQRKKAEEARTAAYDYKPPPLTDDGRVDRRTSEHKAWLEEHPKSAESFNKMERGPKGRDLFLRAFPKEGREAGAIFPEHGKGGGGIRGELPKGTVEEVSGIKSTGSVPENRRVRFGKSGEMSYWFKSTGETTGDPNRITVSDFKSEEGQAKKMFDWLKKEHPGKKIHIESVPKNISSRVLDRLVKSGTITSYEQKAGAPSEYDLEDAGKAQKRHPLGVTEGEVPGLIEKANSEIQALVDEAEGTRSERKRERIGEKIEDAVVERRRLIPDKELKAKYPKAHTGEIAYKGNLMDTGAQEAWPLPRSRIARPKSGRSGGPTVSPKLREFPELPKLNAEGQPTRVGKLGELYIEGPFTLEQRGSLYEGNYPDGGDTKGRTFKGKHYIAIWGNEKKGFSRLDFEIGTQGKTYLDVIQARDGKSIQGPKGARYMVQWLRKTVKASGEHPGGTRLIAVGPRPRVQQYISHMIERGLLDGSDSPTNYEEVRARSISGADKRKSEKFMGPEKPASQPVAEPSGVRASSVVEPQVPKTRVRSGTRAPVDRKIELDEAIKTAKEQITKMKATQPEGAVTKQGMLIGKRREIAELEKERRNILTEEINKKVAEGKAKLAKISRLVETPPVLEKAQGTPPLVLKTEHKRVIDEITETRKQIDKNIKKSQGKGGESLGQDHYKLTEKLDVLRSELGELGPMPREGRSGEIDPKTGQPWNVMKEGSGTTKRGTTKMAALQDPKAALEFFEGLMKKSPHLGLQKVGRNGETLRQIANIANKALKGARAGTAVAGRIAFAPFHVIDGTYALKLANMLPEGGKLAGAIKGGAGAWAKGGNVATKAMIVLALYKGLEGAFNRIAGTDSALELGDEGIGFYPAGMDQESREYVPWSERTPQEEAQFDKWYTPSSGGSAQARYRSTIDFWEKKIGDRPMTAADFKDPDYIAASAAKTAQSTGDVSTAVLESFGDQIGGFVEGIDWAWGVVLPGKSPIEAYYALMGPKSGAPGASKWGMTPQQEFIEEIRKQTDDASAKRSERMMGINLEADSGPNTQIGNTGYTAESALREATNRGYDPSAVSPTTGSHIPIDDIAYNLARQDYDKRKVEAGRTGTPIAQSFEGDQRNRGWERTNRNLVQPAIETLKRFGKGVVDDSIKELKAWQGQGGADYQGGLRESGLGTSAHGAGSPFRRLEAGPRQPGEQTAQEASAGLGAEGQPWREAHTGGLIKKAEGLRRERPQQFQTPGVTAQPPAQQPPMQSPAQPPASQVSLPSQAVGPPVPQGQGGFQPQNLPPNLQNQNQPAGWQPPVQQSPAQPMSQEQWELDQEWNRLVNPAGVGVRGG